jgi:hypothetical protein
MNIAVIPVLIFLVTMTTSNAFAIRVEKSQASQNSTTDNNTKIDPQTIINNFNKIKPSDSVYAKIRSDQRINMDSVFQKSYHLIDQVIFEYSSVIDSCLEKARSSIELKEALLSNNTNKVTREYERDIDVIAMLLPEFKNEPDFDFNFRFATKRINNNELIKKTVACEIGYLSYKNNLIKFDSTSHSAKIYNDINANIEGRHILSVLLNQLCEECKSISIEYQTMSGCYKIIVAMGKKLTAIKNNAGSTANLNDTDTIALNNAFNVCKDASKYKKETKYLSEEYIKTADKFLKHFKYKD